MRKYFTIKEKSTNNVIAGLVQDNMTKNMRTILKDTENFYYTQITHKEWMSFYRYCVENGIDELCMLKIKNVKLFGINIEKNDKIYQYENELEELIYKNSKMHKNNCWNDFCAVEMRL